MVPAGSVAMGDSSTAQVNDAARNATGLRIRLLHVLVGLRNWRLACSVTTILPLDLELHPDTLESLFKAVENPLPSPLFGALNRHCQCQILTPDSSSVRQ